MEITGIKVYRVDLPLKEGRYAWSGGNYVEVFDATVVEVETDFGVVGCGESTPLGPAYLPAFAGGVRACLAELAPRLLGADPTSLGVLHRRMDALLKGHPYAKSAIDMACWDILGQVAGMPVHRLLGGPRPGGPAAVPGHLPAGPGHDGRADRRLPGGGLHQVPAEGGRRPPATTSSASASAGRRWAAGSCWWPTPTAAGPSTTRCGWWRP